MAVKLTKSRVKAGRLIPVYNLNRKKFSRASVKYYALHVEDATGKTEFCLLLTMKDLLRLQVRAKNNPEDIPAKGKFTDLFD